MSVIRQGTYAWIPGQTRDDALGTADGGHGKKLRTLPRQPALDAGPRDTLPADDAWIPGQARDDALGTADGGHGKSCAHKPSPRTRCGAQRHTPADGAWIPGQVRDDGRPADAQA